MQLWQQEVVLTARGSTIAYFQLLMRFANRLAISFLTPVVIVFAKEPHSLPVKQKQ